MTEINVERPETYAFTEQSLGFANGLVEETIIIVNTPPKPTGLAAHDRSRAALFESSQHYQAMCGDGYIYLGDTSVIQNLFHDALLAGYQPTKAQVEASGGNDFMWDEVQELSADHHDVAILLSRFGYGGDLVPIALPHTGAYAVTKDALRDIYATLFMRGQEYRKWGWGYPNWSGKE